MQRLITEWFTMERISALLGYVVGAVIGVGAQSGEMTFSQWVWAGIAILCVIQLRLLSEPTVVAAAEEA